MSCKMSARCLATIFTLLTTIACGAEGGPEPGEAPRSLLGTDLDGDFAFDDEGQLIFDQGVQRTFDYFLAADGELSPAELDAWVADQVRAELGDGPEHEQVLDAWLSYRMFRARAAAVLDDPRVRERPQQVEQQLLAALDLHLGDAAIASFERQQIQHAFALQRAYAIPDADARAVELARLSADEAGRFADTRAGRYLAGREAIERAQREGADEQHIAALRQQHFEPLAPGAATRLAALDAKRASWAQRVSEYRQSRERLRRRLADSPAELDAAIDSLEAEHFSVSERRRLRALERIADQVDAAQ